MPDLLDRLRGVLADCSQLAREPGRDSMATAHLAGDLGDSVPLALTAIRPHVAASLGPGCFPRGTGLSTCLTPPPISRAPTADQRAAHAPVVPIARLASIRPFIPGAGHSPCDPQPRKESWP
jgi:hypothetical protein